MKIRVLILGLLISSLGFSKGTKTYTCTSVTDNAVKVVFDAERENTLISMEINGKDVTGIVKHSYSRSGSHLLILENYLSTGNYRDLYITLGDYMAEYEHSTRVGTYGKVQPLSCKVMTEGLSQKPTDRW